MRTAVTLSIKVTISLVAVILAIIGALAVVDILSPEQAVDIAWKSAAVIILFAVAFVIIQLMSDDGDRQG